MLSVARNSTWFLQRRVVGMHDHNGGKTYSSKKAPGFFLLSHHADIALYIWNTRSIYPCIIKAFRLVFLLFFLVLFLLQLFKSI